MEVTDSIHIEATPTVVWEVTRDIERWPEWTPTVTSARLVSGGELQLRSVARIKQPLQPESEWVVTELRAGRGFTWVTHRAGLHMTATHELVADGTGTRNVLRVEATGPLAVLLGPLLRPAMRRALADENRGLKERCEQSARAVSGGSGGRLR